MSSEPAIRQYAIALMEIVNQLGIIDTVTSDLQTVRTCVKESLDLLSRLSSPSVDRNIRCSIIEKAFTGYVNPITLNFLKIIVYNNRQQLLPDIIHAYMSIFYSQNNCVEAQIDSATHLDDNQRLSIQEKLTKKFNHTFILTFKEKPDLLGGFTVLFNNTFIDNSISGKLKTLKQELNRG